MKKTSAPPHSLSLGLFAGRTKRKRGILIAGALVAAVSLFVSFPQVKSWASGGGDNLTGSSVVPALARLSERVTISAAGRGGPYVNLSDGRDVVSSYVGATELVQALKQNTARPLSLASADFDEDGMPDLVSGYAGERSGIVTIQRGNADSIYPNAPEAQERRAKGAFTSSPFLSPVYVFEVGESADFIGTGDFDGDSHWDIVAARRGGSTLHLMSGDGNGQMISTEKIVVMGTITNLVTGEINRKDGLEDIVVAVQGKNGAKAVIFEGPNGALRSQPEEFALPAPATSVALGQLDGESAFDLAIAAGAKLLVVHGRDRKLSLEEGVQDKVKAASIDERVFPSAIKSVVIGEFDGSEGSASDIAVLYEGGSVRVLNGGKERELEDSKGDLVKQAGKMVPSISAWESQTVVAGELHGAAKLLPLRVSGATTDDLLAIDEEGHKLHLLSSGANSTDVELRAELKDSAGAMTQLRKQAEFESQSAPAAVLPMRLNIDALSDLVILEEHTSAPVIALTARRDEIVNNSGAAAAHKTNGAWSAKVILPGKGNVSAKSNFQDGPWLPLAGGCDVFTSLQVGQTVDGRLSPTTSCQLSDGTFADIYVFDGIAGQQVAIGMSAGFDTVLILALGHSDGRIIATDDDGGGGTNSRIPAATGFISLPSTGPYIILANAFSEDDFGPYTLTLSSPGTNPTTSFTVTNTNDSGSGSLRQAIFNANSRPGADVIDFKIGTGAKTIHPTSSLPSILDPVTIDGTTQPGYAGLPLIEVDGSQAGTEALIGIGVGTNNCVLRALVVNNYKQADVYLEGSDNKIEGCFIGIDATGTTLRGINSTGAALIVARGSRNKIGGTTSAARNIIAGFKFGIFLSEGATGTLIQGNYIGTDLNGSKALKGLETGACIFLQNSITRDNTIGGTAPGARNIISGDNFADVFLGLNTTANLVQGNYIGTNPAGTSVLVTNPDIASNTGIAIGGTSTLNNTIGGTTTAARNIISGGGFAGLHIEGGGNNLVQGNHIGTDVSGAIGLGNDIGVNIFNSTRNAVGGAVAGARNVISGNKNTGVKLYGGPIPSNSATESRENAIQGNFIGTNAAGSAKVSNGGDGVIVTVVNSLANNMVGGATPDARNVISGNNGNGVSIGVRVTQGIGAGDPLGTGGRDILVQNNYIGTDVSGNASMGNGSNGIFIDADSVSNKIQDNVITSNRSNGILIPENINPGVRNNIESNRIYNNTALGIDLGVSGITPNDPLDTDGGANLQQNFPLLSAGSSSSVNAPGNSRDDDDFDPLAVGRTRLNLNSAPNKTYAVQVFFSTGCQNSQFTAPSVLLNKLAMTTDAQGNAALDYSFTFPGAATSGFLLSTATDDQNNTSEHSPCLAVSDAPPAASPGTLQFASAASSASENGGAATITVTRTGGSAGSVSVNYATSNGTATAGSDYTAKSGTLTFADGVTSQTFSVSLLDDSAFEEDETINLTLSGPTGGATLGTPSTAVLTLQENDPQPPAQASVQFSQSSYSFTEGQGLATLTVTRTGNPATPVTLTYRTEDTDTFTVGCADRVGSAGSAYARCDFATAVGVLSFAAGETSKTVAISIIDDGHQEPSETFGVRLSGVTGATLGTANLAAITIQDNDAASAPNPVLTTPFLVRQQYLDFLSREPEPGEPWSGVLNRCPNPFNFDPKDPSAGCDRIIVSQSFFGSPEFQLKGFYVFRFYRVGLNRLPAYQEVISDMSFVAGQTAQEVYARKAELATLFTERQEFQTLYGAMSNAQYVGALMNRYQLTQIVTPDPAQPDTGGKVTLTTTELTNRLGAGGLTRAQVLRAVADSDEVGAREYTNAFVGMQYYGYLRRTPDDAGFRAWFNYLTANPTDARTMVNGFLNSSEYRLRFGQP